jgi:hypothetical protein
MKCGLASYADLALGTANLEHPEGGQITRLRPLRRPSQPKQHRDFHQAETELATPRAWRYCWGQKKRWFKFPIHPNQYQWYEPQSQLALPGVGSDHHYAWFDNYFVDRLAIAAKWLDTHAVPQAVVASTPAGFIAYHMNLRVIDMLGLNDAHIGHTSTADLGKGRAGHEKGDGKYVLSRSPDYILMGNVAVLPYPVDKERMAKKLVRKSEHELWAEPRFHDTYELVCFPLSDTGVFRSILKVKEAENEACEGLE